MAEVIKLSDPSYWRIFIPLSIYPNEIFSIWWIFQIFASNEMGKLKKNFQNFYSLSFHFIYFFKSKSGNTKTMQIYSFRSAKFNFMQVVHPMLTSFHCVPYLMKFKQREQVNDLIMNAMNLKGTIWRHQVKWFIKKPAPLLLLVVRYQSYPSEEAVSDQSTPSNSIKWSKNLIVGSFFA